MDGCRALNSGSTFRFRMDSTSRRKVGKNDGQSKEETDGIIADHRSRDSPLPFGHPRSVPPGTYADLSPSIKPRRPSAFESYPVFALTHAPNYLPSHAKPRP